MIIFFESMQAWHWLSLGIFLLLLEVLGAGGFLLGIGFAALALTAWLVVVPELHWYWQWIGFAVLSIVFTLIYWKKFRRFNEATESPLLNSRTQQLIGRSAPLIVAVSNGTGKVQIEDALWTVRCAQDLPVGTIVKITGADGMMLLAQPQAGHASADENPGH